VYVFRNENPKGKKTTDCVIRAITTATGKTYEEVARELLEWSLKTGFAFNDKRCYQKYLESLGFKKQKQVKKSSGKWYSISEIAEKIENGLVHATSHLTCIKDGNVYDTWDCSKKKAGMFYVREDQK